jgi:hypothetical protein
LFQKRFVSVLRFWCLTFPKVLNLHWGAIPGRIRTAIFPFYKSPLRNRENFNQFPENQGWRLSENTGAQETRRLRFPIRLCEPKSRRPLAKLIGKTVTARPINSLTAIREAKFILRSFISFDSKLSRYFIAFRIACGLLRSRMTLVGRRQAKGQKPSYRSIMTPIDGVFHSEVSHTSSRCPTTSDPASTTSEFCYVCKLRQEH